MNASLLNLLACPDCRAPVIRVDDALVCRVGHRYPIVNGIPRFAGHWLPLDQRRVQLGFAYEWTQLYPTEGVHKPETGDLLLDYTRTVPLDWKGKLVLDAGCGNGRFASQAAQWGARVVAVDLCDSVEVAARNCGLSVDVLQADLTRLPFRWHLFDLVYCVGVLHHVPKVDAAVLQLRDVTKPGGTLRLFVLARGNRVLYLVNRLLRKMTSRWSYRATWAFARILTAMGLLCRLLGPVGQIFYLVGRQVCFFSPDQHNNYDHYAAGHTRFHLPSEVVAWYQGWSNVVVRTTGIASECIYATGQKPKD